MLFVEFTTEPIQDFLHYTHIELYTEEMDDCKEERRRS